MPPRAEPRASQPILDGLELERLLEHPAAGVGPHAGRAHSLEALQRELGRDLPVARDQRLVGAIDDDELVRHALGVGERKAGARALRGDALAAEAVGPEVERLARADPREDAVHHARPRAARRRTRVLEERQIGPAAAELVGVEEVVDARIVLVDGLLDHPQTQQASVEIDVPGGVARDRRDVVNPLQLHRECSIAAPGSGNGSSPSSRVRRATNSLSSACTASSSGGCS